MNTLPTSNNNDSNIKEIYQELWEERFYLKREGWLTMLSGSMHPLMPIDAKILVNQAPIQTICRGDIILFKKEGRLIAHWVIGVKKENDKITFLQQGNNFSDPYIIDSSLVLGKVVAVNNKNKIIKLDNKLRKLLNISMAIRLRIRHKFSQTLDYLRI